MYKKELALSLILTISTVNAQFYYSNGKKIELQKDIEKRDLNNIRYYRTNNNKSIGVDNSILIKFRDESSINSILKEYNLKLIKKISKNIYRVQIDSNSDVFNVSNNLYKLKETEFAHPNLHIEKTKRSYDPLYSDSWHLDIIDITGAWQYSKGENIKIGIIDDGVDINHEDLKDNIAYGYDFDEYDNNPSPDSRFHTHGTNCAGVILAVENNLGSVGVAPKAKLYPVKWNGSALSTTIEALEWLKNQDVDIISNSWGTYAIADALNDELRELALNGRDGKGIITIFASGNDELNLDEYDVDYGYIDDESESPWTIGVGATNQNDTLAYYSNYGSNIDIVAPAASVTTDVTGEWGDNNTAYTDEFGGTSSSAPLLSGVVALMLGSNPQLSKSEVESILKTTADKIGGVTYDSSGFNIKYAYGRVNAKSATQESYSRKNTDNSNIFVDINSLSNGWHLLGTEIELGNIKDDYGLISVWTYENGYWSKNPNQINAGRGYWIHK